MLRFKSEIDEPLEVSSIFLKTQKGFQKARIRVLEKNPKLVEETKQSWIPEKLDELESRFVIIRELLIESRKFKKNRSCPIF